MHSTFSRPKQKILQALWGPIQQNRDTKSISITIGRSKNLSWVHLGEAQPAGKSELSQRRRGQKIGQIQRESADRFGVVPSSQASYNVGFITYRTHFWIQIGVSNGAVGPGTWLQETKTPQPGLGRLAQKKFDEQTPDKCCSATIRCRENAKLFESEKSGQFAPLGGEIGTGRCENSARSREPVKSKSARGSCRDLIKRTKHKSASNKFKSTKPKVLMFKNNGAQ
jgi:hypothetical protein